jgi:hypothetical protein
VESYVENSLLLFFLKVSGGGKLHVESYVENSLLLFFFKGVGKVTCADF